MEKRFSAIILASKKLPLITTRVFSTEVSLLFVVVSGNNTEKSMEGHDRMINAATHCLREADGLVPPVQQQLDSKMSQEKSDISKKLAMLGEINDYLEKLESKNNEIDRVMNQIEEMVSYLF